MSVFRACAHNSRRFLRTVSKCPSLRQPCPISKIATRIGIHVCSNISQPVTSWKRYASSVALVGLANVGKSSLFNGLTGSKHLIANYPFATMETLSSMMVIPDKQLDQLAAAAKSDRTLYTTLEVFDVPGLIKGAASGAGLGNKFLSSIDQANMLVLVLRCFTDTDIVHVEDTMDAERDLVIVQNELVMKDLQQVENRLEKLSKRIRAGDAEATELQGHLEGCMEVLGAGQPLSDIYPTVGHIRAQEPVLRNLLRGFLSVKPIVYALNVGIDEANTGNDECKKVQDIVGVENTIVCCGLVEAEAAQASNSEEERLEFLRDFGVEQSALPTLAQKCTEKLSTHTFYTIGDKEARAWTINQGWTAPHAAGVIHSDLERGFISAEVIEPSDFLEVNGSREQLQSKGLIRREGKGYIVQAGDILNVHFNV
jgi:ribosome-binding ATPase